MATMVRPLAAFVRAAGALCAGAAVLGTVAPVALAQPPVSRVELEEIVVTAQKREQESLDVPVAVGTFTSRDILNTGALTLQQIDDFIPGFEADGETFTQQSYNVRGISSPNISTGGDPSVATFYDEVYLPRAATTMAFADMERVEVLMGPQGTLFGRNAAVGVINMVPRAPADEFEAFVNVRGGNYNLLRVEGMVNVPVSDTFALRANVLSNERDGIARNVGPSSAQAADRDNQAARIAAAWDATDATRAYLAYDWDRFDQSPTMAIGISPYAYGTDPFAGRYENDVREAEETRDMYGVTGKLFHDFSEAWSGKLILSYREWETTNREDEDGTADATRYFDTNNREDSDIFYSEMQFNFANDRIDAVFGANYSRENTFQSTDANALGDSITRLVTNQLNSDLGLGLDHLWNPEEFASALNLFGIPVTGAEVAATGDFWYDTVAGALNEPMIFGPSFRGVEWTEAIQNEGDFTNWGIYGDVAYHLSERLDVIGGLRYSEDEKEFSWLFPPTSFAALRPGVSNQIFMLDPQYASAYTTPLESSDSWSQVTGRAVVQYFLSEDFMGYLSYSTGYKSGGFDSLTISSAAEPLEPEESEMVEIGLKGDLLEGRLRAQVALFNLQVDGRQTTVDSRQPGTPNAIPTVINIDNENEGLELTLDWMVTDSLKLGGLTTVRNEDSTSGTFYNSDAELTDMNNSGDTATTYTLRLDWSLEVPGGELLVHADYVYEENTIDENAPNFFEELRDLPRYFDDSEMLNARLAWISGDGHYEIALWGKNLLDKELIQGVRTITRSSFGTTFVGIEDPLTWGLEGRYTW